ncbi:MAG TPA: 4-alpha-glucanotransferase [Methylibium sp.]|uniref:4-alpha-glucanotransferase n=1 Tax=Methylibium sp. TaxID=2067992 RepID=UPI002DBC8332|nr:4-alpha-glucanotransferase [Methylibium sp.]HEU4460838.1 4-alpha-glucanotransferase [Methylibium sp.]
MRFPRSAGLLLHPTSLPGPHGSGDLGPDAYRFVDWLASAGQTLWQLLPLGNAGAGHSPYSSPSAFAGNVALIDLAELQRHGWLDADDLRPEPGFDARRVAFAQVLPFRMQRLARAALRFAAVATPAARDDFEAFCAAHASWLGDYALFAAIGEAHPERDWCDWPRPLARREPAALAEAAEALAGRVFFWQFTQWCFFRQWRALKAHAMQRGVRIVGDAPIFVAHHSADVWARPQLFELDAEGRPTLVAGVPPDYFSPTGQRWGNPLYRWPAHAAEGFAWWTERIGRTVELVDVLRIDHFRGFAACWEIDAREPTAIHGRWAPAPGEALFDAVARALGPLPIIAEDLGIITPDVTALRKRFDFPGMAVLQFAFGRANPGDVRYLPHSHEPDSVVYTGTHDNDTTPGWWRAVDEDVRHHVREYFACDGSQVHWDFIRAANASVADLAIVPMQDVLGLGSEHRMNLPGTAEGNWSWRFGWDDVPQDAAWRLAHLASLYQRRPG